MTTRSSDDVCSALADGKRVTIKDLARDLGLAVSTVNKALNGKRWVSEETRQRVVEAARNSGYRPNRLAQALVRRAMRLLVVYRGDAPTFYEPLVAGVRRGLVELQDFNVSAEFISAPISTANAIRSALASADYRDVDGMIICPGAEDPNDPVWKQLDEQAIPYVLLGTGISHLAPLACVSVDARLSGQMAAAILRMFVGEGQVCAFLGNRIMIDQSDKADAFCQAARNCGLKVVGVYETLNDPIICYQMTKRVLSDNPQLSGIYIATDTSEDICRYLVEQNLAGKIKVVATSILPSIGEMMELGAIQFTFYQNMVRQGYVALHTLYRFLTDRTRPASKILIPPSIRIRDNLDELVREQELPPHKVPQNISP